MSATPYRKAFYEKLGDDEAKVNDGLKEWLGALEKVLRILNVFVNSKAAKW